MTIQTTQKPVEAVLDRANGKLVGFVAPGSQELYVGPAGRYSTVVPQPLQRGSVPVNIPIQDGSTSLTTFGGKKRIMDWAGIAGQYAYRNGTMHVAGLQFGTRSTDTPASTSFDAYVTDIETGGAQPALFTPVVTDGVMSIAGGRWRQYSTGGIRLMHYADDALFSNSPRFQLTSFPLPMKKRIVCSMRVQFGDAETPYPAYVAGKENNLFWQLKGSTGQPPLALVCVRRPDGSLRLMFNRKSSNATGIYTAATIDGLAVNTTIDIEIHFSLDWLTYDENGSSYVALFVNGQAVTLSDSAGSVEGFVSTHMPTVFTDVAQTYNLICGIYRYDYNNVKAPDNSCVIFHRLITYQ